jgi:uncharacterized protein (TIGR02453 family)
MSFNGFSKDATDYLRDLSANNNREWFNANKERYESHLMEPAKAFVTALGESLIELAPNVVAEPRVNGSIFRINRDTRFSKDKTPYKDHLAFRFWTGADKKAEASGFFLRFFHNEIGIGAGAHEFSKPALGTYRSAVDNPTTGKELAAIFNKLEKAGVELDGEQYKKVPREYDHPRGELLKYKGLFAYHEGPLPREFGTASFVTYCAKQFKQMLPIHSWLNAFLLKE